MNRNKKQNDWTGILRERLQDARLPLEDGWAAPGGQGHPAAEPEATAGGTPGWRGWTWALAGVAAVLAAVLLLRPAAPVSPAADPVRLVEAPVSGPQTAAEVSAPEEGLLARAEEEIPAQTRNRREPASTAGPQGRKQPQAEDDGGGTRSGEPPLREEAAKPRTEAGAAGNTPPEQVPEDAGAVRGEETGKSLGNIALEDLPEEPAASSREASRHGPVRLRLQAGGPGFALAVGGAASAGVSENTPYADPGTGSSSPGQTIPNSNPSADTGIEELPLSFGVSAAVPLSACWALSAGLEYARRPGRIPSLPGNVSVQRVSLHYLGIPVELQYYFNPEQRLRFYLGSGLKVEKCIAVSGALPLPDPFLFSLNLQAGADLRVLPGVRLYLAPSLTRYLNRSAYSVSWDNAPLLGLRAGLSFDLEGARHF